MGLQTANRSEATEQYSERECMVEISVVIPTCDRPLWLQRALRSVRTQSHVPCEVIVVDNGITPLPAETLPQEVSLLRLSPQAGAGSARNAGAKCAGGDYIAFLDDDDEWAPDYLAQMKQAIDSDEAAADMLIGHMFDSTDGTALAQLQETANLLPCLLTENPGTGGPNTVVRRSAFLAAGGYDPDLCVAEDRALAIEFLLHGFRLFAVPEATVLVHRGRQDHLSKSAAVLSGTAAFYRKYRHLMDRQERLLNRSRLLALQATRNRDRNWPLSKLQRLCSRFLKRLALRAGTSKVPEAQSFAVRRAPPLPARPGAFSGQDTPGQRFRSGT